MKNFKILTVENFDLDDIFVNNIIYVPISVIAIQVSLSQDNSYFIKDDNGINYKFNGRVEGIYNCYFNFIVIDLGKIKVYSLVTKEFEGLKEGMWIQGIVIFELDFRYWITDMNETVKPRMPPNIFYQYKINTIQKIETSRCYHDIVKYGDYIELAEADRSGSLIIDVDLQDNIDPDIFPSIASGTEFHMRYLKPDWYI